MKFDDLKKIGLALIIIAAFIAIVYFGTKPEYVSYKIEVVFIDDTSLIFEGEANNSCDVLGFSLDDGCLDICSKGTVACNIKYITNLLKP
tara:strand:- start:83170 stop:83439 length:270 start_codon:yes stop_codon:yes gene_type:complete